MDVKLLMATIAEAVDEVMWLLDNGACPRSTASNLHGTTPSMVAAGAGSLTSLRLLAGRVGLRHVCWARDLLGQVALHHAAMSGQLHTLRFLLLHCGPEYSERGVPRSSEGASAVQMAAAVRSGPDPQATAHHKVRQAHLRDVLCRPDRAGRSQF